MRSKTFELVGFLIILSFLQGCSGLSDKEPRTRPDGTPMTEYQVYENEIKDGVFYVRHSDSVCEPVYFGEATFEKGSVSKIKNDKRVLWFRDDYSRIPTLYKGESLIYYTQGLLDEQFTYERFEDFGYSIGMRGLEKTSSGRYLLHTDPEKKCTYPASDADAILEIKNSSVLIDSIGDVKIRAAESESANEQPVTRCGSIAHLTKDYKYNVMVYEGTVEHSYTMAADVRIMGSMEGQVTADYSFVGDNTISLILPDTFNSGFYLINGVGLFRYIDGTTYDEASTDMNVPNSKESAVYDTAQANGLVKQDDSFDPFAEEGVMLDDGIEDKTENDHESMKKVPEDKADVDPSKFSKIVSKFNITSPGKLSIFITFEDEKGKVITDASNYIVAVITSPEGESFSLQASDDSTLTIDFEATDTGVYKINYAGLTDEIPKVQVTTI